MRRRQAQSGEHEAHDTYNVQGHRLTVLSFQTGNDVQAVRSGDDAG